MQEREIPVYPYRFVEKRTFGHDGLFDRIDDYAIDAVDRNTGETVPYTFRSYRYDGFLYVTDIFPTVWDNDPMCFKRIMSREGIIINMRRVSVTCLVLFVEQYISLDGNATMVVSGSYEPGETEDGSSRKLGLYRAFFEPLTGPLNLRMVDMPGMNAFVLLDKRADLADEHIRESYAEFKRRNKNGNA